MPNIHVAILDDHQIIIDGLKLLLQSDENVSVVCEANDGFSFLDKLRTIQEQPDIILLDLMMPKISGYETALMINESFPEIKIIVLSMNNNAETIYNLIEKADIKGFLPKSVNKIDLLNAIHKIHNGGFHFHEDILAELENYKVKVYEKEKLMISPRELDVIRLIQKGHGNKEIAAQLFISEFTVSTHRKNIFRKTNTHNVAALVDLVNRLQLLH